jgi:hypothetical protein
MRRQPPASRALCLLACAAATLSCVPVAGAAGTEDAGALVPSFKEGDVIGLADVDKLRPFLPDEFWRNRDFFFYEGMQLTIGRRADYTPSQQFQAATRFKDSASAAEPENYGGRPSRSRRSTARRTRRPASS